MTEQPNELSRERHPPEALAMPGWVPTTIGVVLVAMAALAVWTGLRYRNPTLAGNIIHPHRTSRASRAMGRQASRNPAPRSCFRRAHRPR
jgi:hypothetical protein